MWFKVVFNKDGSVASCAESTQVTQAALAAES